MNKLDVINNILKNKKFFLYHGTTRCFENHEIKRARTILNNDFQGDWICYTDNINVAWKYAGANRNQNIDNILFFEELNDVLNKINKNHKIIPFIINLSKNFEKFNYTDSWDLAIKESKMEKKEIFDNLDNFFSKIKNLDINDYCDILKELEYTNQEKENDFFDIFKSKSDSFSIYIIESMRKMGFKKSIPEERVYFSEIIFKNPLITNSREEAKNAKKNGFDLVYFYGDKTVDDVPEFLILNNNQIKIKKEIVRRYKMVDNNEYIGEDIMINKEKKRTIANKI